jgi:SAM-dependent methyltransferase
MPNPPSNYFTSAEVAARYAKARPFFHDEVMKWICEASGRARFGRALDVGCGSGQSSVALAEIADEVVGVDCSQGMLDEAAASAKVRYQIGRAEELNFEAGEFDLVTVGSALHWFEQDRFFAQCRRVLAEAGVLAVYNDHFTAHMQEVVDCKRWMRTSFAKRFPPPRRGMRDIDERKAEECGFAIGRRASFNHVVRFTREEFVAYLLTRSNTLAAIDSGRETQESIAEWLGGELAAIVPDGVSGAFLFKCNLWLLDKAKSL